MLTQTSISKTTVQPANFFMSRILSILDGMPIPLVVFAAATVAFFCYNTLRFVVSFYFPCLTVKRLDRMIVELYKTIEECHAERVQVSLSDQVDILE